MVDLLPGIQATSSALSAERIRTDIIAQNIANSMTTRGADGKIYQRQTVVFETALQQQTANQSGQSIPTHQVNVKVQDDNRPPRLVPDPSNPGKMIEVPDINVHSEMIDLIISQRTYEANLAVAKSCRSMALQTLTLGKRG
ncbi:MAG: flagellar basal body rod protein FlgC [Verrucomicrobiales bacterium]|nr:flagellar basal body rod protein FlgC [Verrucomicrobiales bacterium]